MKKIILKFTKSTDQSYPIFIGNNLVEKISTLIDFKKYSKVFIVTDNNLKPILNRLLQNISLDKDFIVLPGSEKEKNIENTQKIWKALKDRNYDRKSLLLNLGGGVICDMGGFAASTFMRGIDFINIPTTLLSQVDASVGGKNGIDFVGVKNLIGTFSQPKAVIIDVDTLKTLPKREFISGFAEIIKHGLIYDKKYFAKVTSKKPFEFTKDELIEIITRSIEIKKAIVESDQTETGNRKLLNFGHTIGHAIEALSLKTKKPLLHGEAISIGMVLEAKISIILSLLPETDLESIKQALTNAGLSTETKIKNVEELIALMESDKKNQDNQINFTLLSKIGKAYINKTPDIKIIRKALV